MAVDFAFGGRLLNKFARKRASYQVFWGFNAMGIRQQLLAVLVGGCCLVAAVFLVGMPSATASVVNPQVRPLPEFTHQAADEWLNSAPLTVSHFKGKVLLVEFWTFECWNCYRSFPWLNDLYQRLQPQGLAMLGVHTPEFAREKVRSNIQKKLVEFDVRNPVMIDNDFSYWRALGNQYWPAFYLVDKQGRVRALFVGETHKGDKQAEAIEQQILKLLAEPEA